MTRGVYAAVFLLVGLGVLHNLQTRFLVTRSSVVDYTNAVPPTYHAPLEQEFSWDKVSASKKLVWNDCYEQRECARLLVPMDYSNPDGEQYNLALIRKRAAVPPESEEYRGPVMFNPGGPGGSGVDLIRGSRGEQLSAILGPQFDVLSFDPRGIARSSPRVSFFKSDVERELWGQETRSTNATDVARLWARARVNSLLAAETDTGYLRHVNTGNTARDMLRIVEAHGRSKIQYWGFSYGTLLGATFAAMFPDNVERIILDAVINSEDYYSSNWLKVFTDTEKVMESFYTGCAAAGPDGCPFWAPTASSIRQNLTALSDSLRRNPVPVRTSSRYGLLDINKFRATLFTGLYKPYEAFPAIARGLAELAAGSADALFDMASAAPYECACDASERASASVEDSSVAVICNDGDDVPGDYKSAQELFALSVKESPQWGDMGATSLLSCVGWPKFPKEKIRGRLVANTSHPILLIGNTADPVTPLWGAHSVSKGFKNSVVLTQNSFGHGSISAPSLCTQKYVRDYFVDGTLPQPSTVCEPLTQPFPPAGMRTSDLEAQAILSSSSEEAAILKAVLDLSKNPGVVPFSLRSISA